MKITRVGFITRFARPCRHPPAATPALERGVSKLPKHPCRLPATGSLVFRLAQCPGEPTLQALIAGKAKYVIHSVLLAPAHQLLAGKIRICSQNDAHLRPPFDLTDQPFDLFDRTA